jgi:hypothetical protein
MIVDSVLETEWISHGQCDEVLYYLNRGEYTFDRKYAEGFKQSSLIKLIVLFHDTEEIDLLPIQDFIFQIPYRKDSLEAHDWFFMAYEAIMWEDPVDANDRLPAEFS